MYQTTMQVKNEIKLYHAYNKLNKNPNADKNLNYTKITNQKNIANKFNNYFTNIGQSITQGIKYKGSKTYSYYLNKNLTSTFTFDHIHE